MKQLSLLDYIDEFKRQEHLEGDPNEILTEENIHYIREKLLIETVSNAFGLSRGGNTRKPLDEAWDWILSEDRKFPFSFDRCCREMNADPDTVLESLRYYRRKYLS